MMCQACEYTYLVRCIVFMCNTQTHPQTVVHRVCVSQVTMSTFVSAGKQQMYSNRNTHTHTHTHTHTQLCIPPLGLIDIWFGFSGPSCHQGTPLNIYILVHHCGFDLLTRTVVHGAWEPETSNQCFQSVTA